jgi:hypothetical protein
MVAFLGVCSLLVLLHGNLIAQQAVEELFQALAKVLVEVLAKEQLAMAMLELLVLYYFQQLG